MLRRLSTRPQQHNDENVSQQYQSKNHISQNQQQQQQQQQQQPLQQQQVSSRQRHALGVIPNNALNSQHQSHITDHDDALHSSNFQQQQQRSKIPVLVDSHSRTQQHQQQHHPHHHQNIKAEYIRDTDESDQEFDEDEDDEDSYYYTNEPMSPIINRSIANKITQVYQIYDKDTLDPTDEDTYDTTMVAEYGKRIFNYMHELEIKFKPNPKYVEDIQSELLWEHRAVLMDWLIKLHGRFNLLPETLFLAVNTIDRFLSLKNISLSKYQLCGAAALFIAAKYEEINVPTVSQMLYMTGDQYERQEFLSAEKYIIGVLGFEFGWPGPMSFLRRGSKADNYDTRIRTLAKYFLEVTIMDPRFVASQPSWLAAGAQYLARQMLGVPEWTDAHIYYTGFTIEQLAPLSDVLEQCCIDYQTHHKHIYEKYSDKKFMKCSKFVQSWLKMWAKENRH